MEGLYSVDILGRERDIYFGLPAMEYVFNKVDFDVFDSASTGKMSTGNFKTIVYFIYAGLMGGCDRKDQSLDFKYEDLYSEVEKLVTDGGINVIMALVSKAFSESTFLKSEKKVKVSKKK